MKKEFIWVVTGESESSDRSGPTAYREKPTDEQLRAFIAETGEELDCDGPGEFGSYVYLEINKIELK